MNFSLFEYSDKIVSILDNVYSRVSYKFSYILRFCPISCFFSDNFMVLYLGYQFHICQFLNDDILWYDKTRLFFSLTIQLRTVFFSLVPGLNLQSKQYISFVSYHISHCYCSVIYILFIHEYWANVFAFFNKDF